MRRMALPVFLVCGLLAAGASPWSRPDSGIRGRVQLGPLTPFSPVGGPARSAPFQTVLDVVRADDSFVMRVHTRENGTFSVRLAPGEYIVRSASSAEVQHPAISPVEVTVPAHTIVGVTIFADSGIR